MTAHSFHAVAFEENLILKETRTRFPNGRFSPQELTVPLAGGGTLYLYPFGAAVFVDVASALRQAEITRLAEQVPSVAGNVVSVDLAVLEEEGAALSLRDGALVLDCLNAARSGVVALIVAQSATMEYYERLVETLIVRTTELVAGLERRGTVPYRTRPLHRFIGEAVGTRNEVIAVLHLLDRPDAAWEDRSLDEIYDDLRAEFDLGERYEALEAKLRAVQESLEIILDVARDRRMAMLEITVVLLIALEIVLGILKR